jgi:AcrR family transcriptional regulator
LRDEILQAAERLLLKTGDENAVSIRAIAQAVGVTPPSIYLHFADKTELIFAVCEKHFQRFDDYTESVLEGVTDPARRLNLRGRAYVEFGLNNREHYRIMFMGKADTAPARFVDERVAGQAAFDHLVAEVENCKAAGVLEGDAFVIACGLWAKVHGLTSLLISKPNFPWPPVDVFLESLRT